ncbi:hypothetical protein LCGC14_2692760, partial [marine sediment metagenome]
GELDSDRANEVLQQVLDDAAARERLKEHLIRPVAVQLTIDQLAQNPFVKVVFHVFALPSTLLRSWSSRIFLARNTREAIVPRGWFSISAAWS